ncbi:helix-turn-helix domain-containing protein [Shewanella sp. BF02_Schw]|nr:helix-turn-helix domain-containing protein [Shewanella sp. BF02_Schw]
MYCPGKNKHDQGTWYKPGYFNFSNIESVTGMPRCTVQDTIKSLAELDIVCKFVGVTKDGSYVISDWGPINNKWIKINLQNIKGVL